MAAEWTKLVSLRSTRWTLLVTAVGTLFVTYLATRSSLHHPVGWYRGFDPTNQSLAGLAVASLAIGVPARCDRASEYGSGTIRSSLAAMPRQAGSLTAKVRRRSDSARSSSARSSSFTACFEGSGHLVLAAQSRPVGQRSAKPACCRPWPCPAPASPSLRCWA